MAPAHAHDSAALGYTTPITALMPSPFNPRKHFGDLDDLAANIRVQGVLVPLLVRTTDVLHGPHLEIVDGERRYRAATLAGVTTVPVIERTLTDDEVLEIQLVAAIQRQDLTPLEEARGYRALIDSHPAKYSAAYLADRIGRSEKYVVDRMRLLQLTPTLQRLLEEERFGVAHAELLAKLKPEDQDRAIAPGDPKKYGREREPGGLWASMGRTLYDEVDDAGGPAPADPYAGLKARTVKELEAWIARHVRFDVQHFAATAPLDFGETAIAVEGAARQPGRGKKVIQITEDYRLEDDAKDASVRVYGRQSWKRADGTEGTSRGGRHGTRVDSPTCEHAVLGVVVVGPGYGTAYPVCIARDRCQVHWAAEIKEREKTAKLRAKGQSSKADAREKKAAETHEQRWKREAAERKARGEAWAAVWKHLQPEVVRQAKAVKTISERLAASFEKLSYDNPQVEVAACSAHGLTWWKALPAALVLSVVVRGQECDDWPDFVKQCGPFLDLKPLQAIRDAHEAKTAAKSESVPAKKGAKKAKAGKAAKKR